MIFAQLDSYHIGLPNGAIITSFEGTGKLRPKLVLNGVLYIPNLACNLLIISQLSQYHPSYGLNFSKDFYVIQDHTSKTEIGVGRAIYELYHFLQAQANHASFISLHSLHRRLGHPSFFELAKFDKTVWTLLLLLLLVHSLFVYKTNKHETRFP